MAWSNDRRANKLLTAASGTRLDRVTELLTDGVDPNSSDPWGRTALHLAVRHAYNNESDALLISRELLAAGAEINAADADGFTPLSHAAIYGYTELLRDLIAAGAEVNHRNSEGQTAIAIIEGAPSLRRRRRRIVKILEQAGGVR